MNIHTDFFSLTDHPQTVYQGNFFRTTMFGSYIHQLSTVLLSVKLDDRYQMVALLPWLMYVELRVAR